MNADRSRLTLAVLVSIAVHGAIASLGDFYIGRTDKDVGISSVSVTISHPTRAETSQPVEAESLPKPRQLRRFEEPSTNVAEPVESEINIPVSVGQEKAQPTRSSTSEPPVDDSRGANAAEAANTTPPPKPEDVSVLKNNSMDSLSAETSTNLHGASELDDPGQSAITESMRSPQVPDVTAVPLYHLIPKPAYPSRSRDLAEEGVVIIAVLVGKDGGVLEAYVSESSGYPLLDGSALTTVIRKWRFKPGMRRGTAVPSWVRVPIKFSILGS